MQLVQTHRGQQIVPVQPVVSRAAAVIDNEFLFVDIKYSLAEDEPLIAHRYFQGPEVALGPLLDVLYWRLSGSMRRILPACGLGIIYHCGT